MELIQPYVSTIVAALIVIALAVLAMIIYKALSSSVRGRRGQRLGISEYHEIDKTRRLVLVRRDDTEHLLLIGGGQDIVVESRINGQFGPSTAPDVEAQRPIPMRPPPRPAVFGERRPPPMRPVEPSLHPSMDEEPR